MIRIRVDDFPTTKDEERCRHTLENFLLFDAVVQRVTKKRYLLGVIPSRSTPIEIDKLSCMNLEIGMHGIDHDERFPNEFRDHLTVQDRVNLLFDSKDSLEDLAGQDVNVYLPPHNVIDVKTLEALHQVGFEAFTGGPETDPKIVYLSKLKYLHSFSPFGYGRSDELLQRGSVDWLRKNAVDIPVYLTLHWTWEHNIGLEHFERYLTQIADIVEDFQI